MAFPTQFANLTNATGLQLDGNFNALSATSGSSLIGFLQSGANTIARTIQSKTQEIISVKDFGAVGDGVTDDTAAIQLAFNTVLSLGNLNITPTQLLIPPGDYKVTALTLGGIGNVGSKDLYSKTLYCQGRLLGTNAAGAVLTIEGMLGVNIIGLNVSNSSVANGTLSISASRSFAVNWYNLKTSGGQTGFQLQGNNNNFYGPSFKNSAVGFLMSGAMSNDEDNTIYSGDFETNSQYNIHINRTSGNFPQLRVLNSYFENTSTSLAMIRINNALNIQIDGCYFGFNFSSDGIIYAGTLAPSTFGTSLATDNLNAVNNNVFNMNGVGLSVNAMALESGTTSAFMRYSRYSNNVLSGNTNANTVLGVSSVYAGSANGALSFAVNTDINPASPPAFGGTTPAAGAFTALSGNNLTVSALAANPSVGLGTLGAAAANGVVLQGNGNVNDVSVWNKSGQNVMTVPTGTINAVFGGNISQAGLSFQTSKTVTATNGLTTYTASTQYNYLTGTAGASFAVTLPAAAAAIDGQLITIMSTASRASTTWASAGATFVGAPASLSANVPVKFQYDNGSTSWYITE